MWVDYDDHDTITLIPLHHTYTMVSYSHVLCKKVTYLLLIVMAIYLFVVYIY